MRCAIGLCFILLMTPSLSHAAGVGMGVAGGLAVPGDSRLFTCRCPVNWDLTSDSVERFGGHIIFYGEQAGPEFGGEIFLKIDPVDIGLGAATFSRRRISGSLISSQARMENRKADDFERRFSTGLLFLRYRFSSKPLATPYLGVGLGIYRLQEKTPDLYSADEGGAVIQGVAGIEAAIGESTPKLFAELRFNFGELEEDEIPGEMGITTLTVALGLRFWK